MNHRLAHDRTANGINPTDGIHRIKAERAEDIPRGHLTAIHVAAFASRRVAVKRGHDLAHALLGFVGCSSVIVEIRDVLALLVALRVLSDQTADIGNGRVDRRVRGEQFIQLVNETLVATVKVDQARHVLLHAEGVLPGIGLGVFVVHQAVRNERRAPFAVGFASAEETRRAVK